MLDALHVLNISILTEVAMSHEREASTVHERHSRLPSASALPPTLSQPHLVSPRPHASSLNRMGGEAKAKYTPKQRAAQEADCPAMPHLICQH